MLHRNFLHLWLLALLGLACASTETGPPPVIDAGDWRMELDLNGEPLPFTFTLSQRDGRDWLMLVHNGEETIAVDDIRIVQDSILIRMPLYDSEFRGVIHSSDKMSGYWHNYTKGPDYKISFTAAAGGTKRFLGTEKDLVGLGGTWEVHFSPGTPKSYNAIGIFEQAANGITTGTFITETGDHRYLEGVVHGDSLKLSCFDGSHAFLYTAASNGDSLHGTFWSGTHWKENWTAVRNPDFRLRHPDSLTFLKEGHTMIDFSFPDLDGRMVSPKDARFRNKPLLIQVMGSWCPNCVDETRFLNELYARYQNQGLEVIAIAFEKYEDPDRARRALLRFQEVLNVEYPILYGGLANKEVVGEKLPFLDHVMSYPTCIYVDGTGTVRRIRTGYYGPGTGEHHTRFRNETEEFVEQLVDEKASPTAALR